MKEIEIKLNSIRKHFKKNKLFLEIYLLDYETYNIYIRLDYIKKLNIYKLSWFNLEVIDINKPERYMGSEYINSRTIEDILNILNKKDNNYHIDSEENTVILNVYFNEGYHYQFNRFIPKELFYLKDIFVMIFDNLPRKLGEFLYELHAEIMGTKSKYLYQDAFLFNLFKEDIDKLFEKRIIERGEKYYKEGNVCFLEKIDDKYYSVVKGLEKYLTIVKYDEEIKKIQLYCTCPCEFYCKHIYAVLKSIRDNKTRKFYKVLFLNKDISLIENVVNSKYLLCSGVEDDCLEIINKYGEIELVPILDNEENLNFKILEDDENNNLKKEIEKLIKK